MVHAISVCCSLAFGSWRGFCVIPFKPEDMWVGLFWRSVPGQIDAWVCILPMLPIHVTLRRCT